MELLVVALYSGHSGRPGGAAVSMLPEPRDKGKTMAAAGRDP
jgi:hypothetical protein